MKVQSLQLASPTGLTLSKAERRTITMEQYEAASEDMGGFCLACGEEASNVEPDARKYCCEACGALQVYGADEWLVMGRVV